MPSQSPIFFDPEGKRWRRLRRGPRHQRNPDHSAGSVFCRHHFSRVVSTGSEPSRGQEAIPRPKGKPQTEAQRRKNSRGSNQRGGTKQPLTPVVLNSLEGIRGAFYVQWDAASFASLREYFPQIDLLFPEWLHVLTADGRLQSVTETNVLFRPDGREGQAASG